MVTDAASKFVEPGRQDTTAHQRHPGTVYELALVRRRPEGHPPNYDNSGVYTSGLLDAYIKNPDPVTIPSGLADCETTDVTPYESDAFSLMRAHTFCQQSMIKVAAEADAAAKDPVEASVDRAVPNFGYLPRAAGGAQEGRADGCRRGRRRA